MALQIFRFHDLGSWRTPICDFLDGQDTSHPFQFPQWSGRESLFTLIEENGKIRWYAHAGIQYPVGRYLPGIRSVTINRGPVCDDPEFWRIGLAELVNYLEDKHTYVHLIPNHVLCSSDANGSVDTNQSTQIAEPRYSLRLDLTTGPESLLSGFRKVARYEVRRAERMGVEVGPAACDRDIEAFLTLYAQMAEEKRFTADAATHIRKIVQWLRSEPNRGTLMIAKYREVLFGGAIILRSGSRCWYVWGASQKHTGFSSGYLVQWRAILWAKSHGCTQYDFGGYTPGATSGPAWFKQGFGGSIVQFAPPRRENSPAALVSRVANDGEKLNASGLEDRAVRCRTPQLSVNRDE